VLPEAEFVSLQRPGHDAARSLVDGLSRAWVHGATVDWAALMGPAHRVDLPTYAFQHEHFWLQPSAAGADLEPSDLIGSQAEARFWAAVEDGDLDTLTGTLAVGAQSPFGDVVPEMAAWRRRERDRATIDGWRYRVTWSAVTEPGAVELTGTWLVVAPSDGTAADLVDEVTAALAGRGARPEVIEGAGLAAARGTDITAGPSDLAGVVSLLALDTSTVDGMSAGVAGTLGLIQALGGIDGAPLWIVTRGAVTTGTGEALSAPVQAQVWGLGRVAALEHPDRWGGLIDLPEVLDERAGRRLCAALAGIGEKEVAIRDAGLLARRLVRASRPRTGDTWRTPGTVLVTGGSGAIAGHVAGWLAEREVPRVVLASRSGSDAAGVPALAARLAACGTEVDVTVSDVTSRDQVAGLLGWIGRRGPALTGVMHTAGVLDDGLLDGMDAGNLATVLAAKATGAALLDELTADADLDAFVLFSSAAATLGGAGQGNYAAANAYLDALAEHRRARGLTATSVAWGLWGGGEGMSAVESGEQVERRGLRFMDPRLAVRALGQALDGDEATVTVADLDWARFAPTFTVWRPSPLIADLPEVRQALSEQEAGPGGAAEQEAGSVLAGRLAGLPRAEQDHVLVNLIRAEAAAALGYPSPDAVEADRPFRDLGFDSLIAVELRNRLNSATGTRLPATLVFDYPTPAELAAYIWEAEFAGADAQPPLLEEIDRLEALLSGGAGVEATTRDLVGKRLQDLLAAWNQVDAPPESAAEPAQERLQHATDDELIQFIHKELGRS
jgi:acyl transferase domain-containing protein/acyl carrier protein